MTRVRNPPLSPFIEGIFNIREDRRREVLRLEVFLLEVRRAPRRPEFRLRVAHPFFAARLRFALEDVRLVVVRLEVRRVVGLRRETRRLEVVLRLEERRREAQPFLAAADRFALEVRGLRLEDVRFAVVDLRRELRLRVAAAFLAAADRLRLFAARVRAAFFAAADRLALLVVLFLPAVLRRAGAFRDLRVVRAILFTFLGLDFLARLPPLGGFTRVSVPRAIDDA
jgi:hypothetical protein